MDCGTSECSNYLFFLTSFYMTYRTNALELSFLHKDKRKQSHILIGQKKKEKKVVSSALTGEIWLIPEDFDSRLFCSPVLPMSVVGYRCELSTQGDCNVGVESPPGH